MDVPKWRYVSSLMMPDRISARLILICLAVDFLMSNGFRMEAPYTEGLPYLSREEEAQVKADLIQRDNFSNIISDLDVKDTDEESLQFLKSVRRDIDEWVALGDVLDFKKYCPSI
jgi:hypothetical protein